MNKAGYCETIPNCLLKVLAEYVDRFWPSINTYPAVIGYILKIMLVIVDFPEPDSPTKAILCPASIFNVKSLKIGLSLLAYLNST